MSIADSLITSVIVLPDVDWETYERLRNAEGNRNLASGGNRYSFIYSGDVNGDGSGANDLIYVPANQSEINLVDYTNASGQLVTAQAQWQALDAFIEQDKYAVV